jgi:hypothetical protein
MEKSLMQKFLDGFAERVMTIVAEQLQIQGASFPLQIERAPGDTKEFVYANKGIGKVLLCIIHDIKFVQEGDDILKEEVTVRQDVQVPKSDGSLDMLPCFSPNDSTDGLRTN